jgi:hypothetical protein
MATTGDSYDPDERDGPPARPSETPRPRSRALIVGAALAAFVLIFAFILLVSQCGTDDDSEIYGAGDVPVTEPAAGGAPVG